MTTHEVLVKAKAYLLEHGWRQGDFGDHGTPRCAVGALSSACGLEDPRDEGWPESMYRSLAAVEGVLGLDPYEDTLPGWNDDGVRTFERVIDAFDRAIIATAPEAKPEDALTAQETIDALSPLALIPMEALA